MKKWLCERFLPMWAKETVLWENRQLRKENEALSQKLREKEAYMKGVHKGMRRKSLPLMREVAQRSCDGGREDLSTSQLC